MERAQTRPDAENDKRKRKEPGSNQEMERILSRTLEQKVKTASK